LSVNLIRNYSFEEGLAGWSGSGSANPAGIIAAFERATVALIGDLLTGAEGILSQLVQIPPDATHFHVVYAVLAPAIPSGSLQVEVEFRGSANLDPPLPLLRTDVIDVIDTGALVELAWETRYAVTGEIPSDARWARLRFVNPPSPDIGVYIDAVFMTTD